MLKQITFLSMAAMLTANAAAINWNEPFDTQSAFDQFTVINANRDDKTWEYSAYNKCARAAYGDIDMDDWLITPSFQLEAGVKYKFTLDARNHVGTEILEVFAATSPTAEAMTLEVIPRKEIKGLKWATLEGEFTIPSSGTWYIGIHGCSAADKLYLDVDNLKLTDAAAPTAPAAVSALQLIPDPAGLNRVTVKCMLPATSVSGSALTAIDKVEVLCDDAIVHSSKSYSSGASFEWLHADATPGNHKYTVAAYAGGQRGQETSAEVFVGPDKPSPVPYLGVGEFTPGNVTIRWNAPETDVNGKAIDPGLITYKVVRYEVMEGSLYYEEDIEDAENISGTEYVHHAIDAGAGQMFTAYGVYAMTAAGRSTVAKTPLFPVGTSYTAPWTESFANGSAAGLYRSETIKYDQVSPAWSAWSDEASEVKAFDADGGFLAMAGASKGDCARYYSGKIDLGALTSPALSFYVYNNPTGVGNVNNFEVYVSDGHGFKFAKEFMVCDMPAPGWNLVTIPLDAYKGATVQFAFQLTIQNYVTTLVDCIKIGECHATDLAVTGITAPGTIIAGADFNITARIENRGTKSVENYEVKLFRGDDLVQTLSGPQVAPGRIAEVTFTDRLPVHGITDTPYHATVSADGDADASNNTCKPVLLHISAPTLPVPSGLTGSVADGNVALEWNAPDLSTAIPAAVTDDFESYTSFATGTAGEWSFVDADGAPIGKFQDIVFPGITVQNQPSSFWVMDATLEDLNSLFTANSGSKYLAQMFTADKTRCDDWAISPELYGNAQTVTFHAKSYSMTTHEEMELLYSTSGKEISDFTLLQKVSNVPNAWTKYELPLPEGAKYFAIRCTSLDCFMLFIDDVTYIPAHGASDIELTGYNIYRNGTRLNGAPLSATEYNDYAVPVGNHEYTVTALYNSGESLPSESFATALNSIDATAYTNVKVRSAQGIITVEGAGGMTVTVHTPDGRAMHHTQTPASGTLHIAARPGVYLVTVGGGNTSAATTKLIVP